MELIKQHHCEKPMHESFEKADFGSFPTKNSLNEIRTPFTY